MPHIHRTGKICEVNCLCFLIHSLTPITKLFNHNQIYIIFDKFEKSNPSTKLRTSIEDQKRFLIAKILHQSFGISEAPKLSKSKLGKLKFKDFNIGISHSGDYLIVGVSKKQFGLDIEQKKTVSSKMQKYLGVKNDVNLLQAWVDKEACLKADPFQSKTSNLSDYILEKEEKDKRVYSNQNTKFFCYNLEIEKDYTSVLSIYNK